MGNQLSKLALMFKACGPRTKRVLVGDPGRWWMVHRHRWIAQKTFLLKCIGKYDLGKQNKEEHFGLVNGFIYEVMAN